MSKISKFFQTPANDNSDILNFTFLEAIYSYIINIPNTYEFGAKIVSSWKNANFEKNRHFFETANQVKYPFWTF